MAVLESNTGTSSVWIGLTCKPDEEDSETGSTNALQFMGNYYFIVGSWTWLDGTPFTYSNFADPVYGNLKIALEKFTYKTIYKICCLNRCRFTKLLSQAQRGIHARNWRKVGRAKSTNDFKAWNMRDTVSYLARCSECVEMSRLRYSLIWEAKM